MPQVVNEHKDSGSSDSSHFSITHRDPSFGIYDGRTALSISISNVESSITFLTQGYFSNTIAIVVIFNYESSITFLTHGFY